MLCIVVTESKYYDTYKNLTTDTDGLLANINENFLSAFLPIVVNIGADTNSGRWVRLSNGMVVKLDADPSIGDIDVDTDGDGVPDLIELGKEVTTLVYNPLTRKHESYKTWTFYSNPVKVDTDGDDVTDLYDINPCKYDITAEIKENETIKFNTGKVWNYLECSLADYLDNFYVYTGVNSYAENPIDITSFRKIIDKVYDNEQYSFTVEELSIIGLFDNDGSKLYMDNSTRTVREAVFKSIVGREPTYYQRKGMFSSTRWEEVPYGTESSFWRGSVITEADLNFSTGIYSFFNTFDIDEVMEVIGIVTIVLISVAILEAVPVVISNMQALVYYIRNFGIVQGCGMYMTLGAEGLPNGVISWLQADMADGDSSLDDFVEKGGAGTMPTVSLNISSQQLGQKWGKHRFDYPNLTGYKEYEQFVKQVFSNPDKIILDSINKEYLYIQGKELLRIKLNGQFVSLYPGADTDLVKKAIEIGGLLWEK